MTCLLDTAVGGMLPYVYCKKITLDNNPDNSDETDVTLMLELYQEKNSLLK